MSLAIVIIRSRLSQFSFSGQDLVIPVNGSILTNVNPADQLLTLADGENHTTSWGYDTFGRVTNKVDAASNELFRYQYDVLDRLTNRWSAAKGNTGYKYDPIGNLTNVDYATSSDITLRYDGLNRLTNMVDAVGTTVFTWTDGDQLASEDGPWASDKISYTYANRLRSGLSLQQPNASAWTQSYGYDDFMRLSNVTSPAGSFDYRYYLYPYGASDRVLKLDPPGGSSINNSYDELARLLSTVLKDGSLMCSKGVGS